jgi:hypothetical protein
MSWTQDQNNSAQQIVNQNKQTATNELSALPYYQELATRGIGSGKTSLANSQTKIDTAIDNIVAQTNLAKQAATAIQQAQQVSDTASVSADIGSLKSQVEQKQALQDLRQEQANALANKYVANDHSPFLFFYAPFLPTTPLSDVVRTVLYFLSLVMFVGGVFLLKPNLLSSGLAKEAPRNAFGNMMGGSRSKRH